MTLIALAIYAIAESQGYIFSLDDLSTEAQTIYLIIFLVTFLGDLTRIFKK